MGVRYLNKYFLNGRIVVIDNSPGILIYDYHQKRYRDKNELTESEIKLSEYAKFQYHKNHDI